VNAACAAVAVKPVINIAVIVSSGQSKPAELFHDEWSPHALFTSPPVVVRIIAMSMSVCLSVCLSASQSKQWVDVDGSVGQMGQFFDGSYGSWVDALSPMTHLHIYRKHVVKATSLLAILSLAKEPDVSNEPQPSANSIPENCATTDADMPPKKKVKVNPFEYKDFLIAQEDYWLFQHPLQSANDILVHLMHAISLPRSETCSFLKL